MAREHRQDHEHQQTATATAVIEVGGLNWASEKSVVEAVLRRRPGVITVDVNPVAQTATVTYDPVRTSVIDMRDWVRDCGYHCRGQSVPSHICDPAVEPPLAGHHAEQDHAKREPTGHETHTGHGSAPVARTEPVGGGDIGHEAHAGRGEAGRISKSAAQEPTH